MNFKGSGSPYSVVILQWVGDWIHASLCVYIAFLCLSVCLFVCLSVCLSVCKYVCLSISLSRYIHLSVCLSHNICGVVPADQGSRARYRAFQVFCWDSKSVPLPIYLSWWKPIIMVLNYALFICCQYPPLP